MKKLKIASIITLVVGVTVLVFGIFFLIFHKIAGERLSDGDFLVEVGKFVMDEGDEAVEWNFTAIGKGTLTTNRHQNDYPFAWAILDNTLKIRTDWLYELDNEYEYSVNQSEKTLTLKTADRVYTFRANEK